MKKIQLILFLSMLIALAACMKENPDYAAGALSPYISLNDLRKMYKGEDVQIPAGNGKPSKIVGVVISDASGGNTAPDEIILQQFRTNLVRGISVQLDVSAVGKFNAGDSLMIEIGGSSLVRRQGRLKLVNVTAANVTRVAENRRADTTVVSLKDLSDNFDNYESTLIKLIGVNIMPQPVSGDVYSGDKLLDDGTGTDIMLHTEAAASFARRRLPVNATFIGIPFRDGTEGTAMQVRMRNEADESSPSGPLYNNFPEDFEQVLPPIPTVNITTAYALAVDVNLKTGTWFFDNALLGKLTSDVFQGTTCIRMNRNLTVPGLLQMNFDLLNGASKVTIFYGLYSGDSPCTWRLEYSQDGGATWRQAGEDITDGTAAKAGKTATFIMDIQGKVRFRINKVGTGITNNGRLCVDNFAVYEN